MTSQTDTTPRKQTAKRIISRFAHLISAQGVDSAFTALLFLYLARWDTTIYGEVTYAFSAGLILMKVVQFGLYFPLVCELTDGTDDAARRSIGSANAVKVALFAVSMIGVAGFVFLKGFPGRMSWILLLVCLGFGLEAFADTFFAYLRVKGRQRVEARIKILSSVLGYTSGFLAAFFSLPAMLIGCFKPISGLVRLVLAPIGLVRASSLSAVLTFDWLSMRRLFSAAMIFGVIDIVGMISSRTNVFFLENWVGVEAVGIYSAAWLTVDSISAMASEQLLGWVIFPLLSKLWMENRQEVAPLARRTAQWLMAMAFPIMFFCYAESDLIVALLYGPKYTDTAWVQRYLVWNILFSFEFYLFSYLMIVAGAQRTLLAFSLATMALNLVINVLLVKPLGLQGACIVLILTKVLLCGLTGFYCQARFLLFRATDFVFLTSLAAACVAFYAMIGPLVTHHPAVAATTVLYFALLWKPGTRFLGKPPRKKAG